MNESERKLSPRAATAAAALITLIVVAPQQAVAETWELQTATEEVPGTRDLEAGRIDKAIRILEWYVEAAPLRQKAPAHTNLCMAYTLQRRYETALPHCNEAVDRDGNSRIAFNNRGVLRALQGDYEGALADFREAGCLYECPMDLSGTASPNIVVARRNIKRATDRFAASKLVEKDTRVSQEDN